MSLSNWISNAAVKFPQSEAAGEAQPLTDRHDGELLILRTNPAYPLLLDEEQVVAAERFSVLRTRVLNAHAKSGIRSVMITSPQKGEGKSLVCVNLAISLAQLGTGQVLLVDADLRVKGISRLFSMEEDSGVGDFLEGRAAFNASIRTTNVPFLFVAGTGKLREGSLPAVLEGSRWSEFLEQAKNQFRFIIVDSVPVAAPIADFELLSAACDAVLLIVHLRKTTREALTLTLQRMDSKLLGLIINNMDARRGFDYYSHYYAKK
jgi:capsular exopolysaccharide synthesis family protein